MKRLFKRIVVVVAFLPIMVFLLSPFFAMKANASQLSETYLFLQRMKTQTSTGMVLLVTPTTSFDSGSAVRILFPAGGDWCTVNDTTMTATGVTSSPIDLGAWDIGAALPGTLVAKCYQGGMGESDYIEITGITALTAGTKYGVSITAHANLITGTTVGNNVISVEVRKDAKVEAITFGINLLANDQVTVSATVASANTISCTISTTSVNLGTLFKGGAYITGGHTFTTNSTSAFYWAIYGVGDGSTAAGLYKSSETAYLLSSAGSGGEVNLLTGEGFGLVLTTAGGFTIPANYQATTPGVFGAIGRTFSGANLIMSHNAGSSGQQTSTVTLGARAGGTAEEGAYTETLTYICGAYVGGS